VVVARTASGAGAGAQQAAAGLLEVDAPGRLAGGAESALCQKFLSTVLWYPVEKFRGRRTGRPLGGV